MLRKVFTKKNDRRKYTQYDDSFESCLCDSHSPRPSPRGRVEGDIASPDVCIVEKSSQAPILVSDASIEDLSLPAPRPAAPRSPRSPRCVRICAPQKAERGEDSRGIEELFFNKEAGSNVSEFGKPSANDECEQTVEAKKTCSCLLSKEPKQAAKSLPLCKIIQESGGASSFPDTECSSWDATARAHYYHHKLMATLQVLANKEETVRVQAESLRLAEARIAALVARAERLRAQAANTHELRSLRLSTDKPERADAAVTADAQAQEVENQKKMVKTLQTNLSVIEDLYRECFYECAKQEELIELLRQSCLEVRLQDGDKRAQIGRLQRVISSQEWSLDRCQDMSMEVENLKMEISSFLNSSNNDSGVWERGEDAIPGDVQQDLRHISAQLRQLRVLLAEDCTCDLDQENMRLKDINEKMQIQVGELRQKIGELEAALSEKERGDRAYSEYKDALAEKEQELAQVKQQLGELRASVDERSAACDALATQLRQAQVSIEDQSRELAQARRCDQELQAARAEEGRLRGEVSELQARLARAQRHCCGLDAGYRDKVSCAATLQAQLEEAHARGATLCEEVRRVVGGVQLWVRRMRARHREQENIIKEQETLIKALQFEKNKIGLLELSNDRDCSKCNSFRPKRSRGRVSETVSCECVTDDRNRDIAHSPEVRERRDSHRKNNRSEIDCECSSRMEQIQVRRKPSANEMDSCVCSSRGERRQDRGNISRNETASCECSRVGERRGHQSKTSESEVASCSSAPTPPRRLLKKKFNPCEEKSWWWGVGVRRRDAGVQQPTRRDARSGDARAPARVQYVRGDRLPREASPSAELEQRVSALHAALARAQGRWARARTA